MGKPHSVNVQRKFRSTWIAAGEIDRRRIEVKQGTEADAVAAWVAAARAARALSSTSA
jgi:hypothetical protein